MLVKLMPDLDTGDLLTQEFGEHEEGRGPQSSKDSARPFGKDSQDMGRFQSPHAKPDPSIQARMTLPNLPTGGSPKPGQTPQVIPRQRG